MTAKRFPQKLGKEPLIDVICGVNIRSNDPIDALLPGLLLSKLAGKTPKFETLPAAQLPKELRDTTDLKNAPLMRVVVDEQFAVLIGSKWVGVGCLMPYAGWGTYKPMIETVFAILAHVPSVSHVERFSMKYVDFLENSTVEEPFSRISLQIEIAGLKLSNQVTQLRTEVAEAPFVHAATILSHAIATKPDKSSSNGVIVDLDTHRIETFGLQEFLQQMPMLLEEMHTANKRFFFNLLTASGLEGLEPAYD